MTADLDWRRPAPPRPYAEVIGDPIAQSKSPLIHNFWLGKLGIDAEYRACHVRAEELADYFAQRRRDAEWRGCNVTMPHKQAVIPLIDKLTPSAGRIGAVNTVTPYHEDTRTIRSPLTGDNSDAAGFLEPLMPLIGNESYRWAYVIGTGGAAKAIIDALASQAFLIFSISRNIEKAWDEFAQYLGNDQDFLLEFGDLKDGDLCEADPEMFSVVVNATSLGMVGNPPLRINWGPFRSNTIVYDIVTSPVETKFLKEASARDLKTIDGLAMLIGQAAAAFEKFFGQPAPREHDAELRQLILD